MTGGSNAVHPSVRRYFSRCSESCAQTKGPEAVNSTPGIAFMLALDGSGWFRKVPAAFLRTGSTERQGLAFGRLANPTAVDAGAVTAVRIWLWDNCQFQLPDHISLYRTRKIPMNVRCSSRLTFQGLQVLGAEVPAVLLQMCANCCSRGGSLLPCLRADIAVGEFRGGMLKEPCCRGGGGLVEVYEDSCVN